MDLLAALAPSESRAAVVEALGAALARPGAAPPRDPAAPFVFDALHLRYETDWVAHCAKWSSIPDGVVRDNCGLLPAAALIAKLKAQGLGLGGVPVYVAVWQQSLSPNSRHLLRLLRSEFTVITREELLPAVKMPGDCGAVDAGGSGSGSGALLCREEAALLDFFLCRRARTFVGNSVSTFSALLIMERRALVPNSVSSWYNGGNVPLEGMVPFFRMPWVFTYNNVSASYDEMLKVAVWSGIHVGRVMPHCLFNGSPDAPIFRWLESVGVRMFVHKPEWADDFLRTRARVSREALVQSSHLFHTDAGIIGSFQRIDIPLLGLPYDHVLFSDADVLFMRRVNAAEFGYPLPKCLGMGWEAQDFLPFNAGVILMNLQCLADSYSAFVEFIKAHAGGLNFGPHSGPVDQGAINEFYEGQISLLPKAWNAKPYQRWSLVPSSCTFTGPSPHTSQSFQPPPTSVRSILATCANERCTTPPLCTLRHMRMRAATSLLLQTTGQAAATTRGACGQSQSHAMSLHSAVLPQVLHRD